MSEHNLLPLLPYGVDDVEFPVDSLQKGHLVGVDLTDLQARDFAPCASRVVAVLQVLRGKDKRRKEHATSALQSTHGCVF